MGKYKTPTPKELIEPILQILSDRNVWKKEDILSELADRINLTEAEIQSEQFPRGRTVLEHYCAQALITLRDREGIVIHRTDCGRGYWQLK